MTRNQHRVKGEAAEWILSNEDKLELAVEDGRGGPYSWDIDMCLDVCPGKLSAAQMEQDVESRTLPAQDHFSFNHSQQTYD